MSAWNSFVPNECFKSGGAEEAGMKGWRGYAADVFTDQGEIEAKKKFALGSVPSDSVKFHDRFLIIDKTTLIHGMRRRNALRFGGKICRRQTRRAPKRPRCVAQPSWQEVLRFLIPRQVKYPRHTGEDITGRGKVAHHSIGFRGDWSRAFSSDRWRCGAGRRQAPTTQRGKFLI